MSAAAVACCVCWFCCVCCKPRRFNTPLFFTEAQLQELSGTTLAAATAARQAALSRSWQQLKPAVEQMLQQVRQCIEQLQSSLARLNLLQLVTQLVLLLLAFLAEGREQYRLLHQLQEVRQCTEKSQSNLAHLNLLQLARGRGQRTVGPTVPLARARVCSG